MKNYFFILFFYVGGFYAAAQQNENIAQESIFVHANTNVLFSGEYLYYKVYALDAISDQLSSWSDIAYVSLLDATSTEIFKHKIVLNNGMGAS